jgi:hypothetical protein
MALASPALTPNVVSKPSWNPLVGCPVETYSVIGTSL